MKRLLIALAAVLVTLVSGASVFGTDRTEAPRSAKSSPIRQTSYRESARDRASKFSSEIAPEKLSSRKLEAKSKPEDACLRLDWERYKTVGSLDVSYATACYVRLFDEFLLISAMHGVVDENTNLLANLTHLTFVTSHNERFALDYGDGSVARRREHEKNPRVSPADYYVKLKGVPLLIEDHDVVVFRLNGPLHGIEPLLPKPSDVEIGDSVSAIVANYRQVGLVRNCRVSEVDRKYGQGVSSLCFVAEGLDDRLARGNSGAAVITNDSYVVAILLQIQDTGYYELSDGFALLKSDTGLAVKMDLLIPAIRNHWRLTGDPRVATRLDSSAVAAR